MHSIISLRILYVFQSGIRAVQIERCVLEDSLHVEVAHIGVEYHRRQADFSQVVVILHCDFILHIISVKLCLHIHIVVSSHAI